MRSTSLSYLQDHEYCLVQGGGDYRLEPVEDSEVPGDFTDCQAFVSAVAPISVIGVLSGNQYEERTHGIRWPVF